MPPPRAVYPQGMVPPDGGYGWVIAAAYALNNIIIIPIIQNFGLVFKDLFADLDISGTDTAVIMNLNNAFGLALGLFNGPILRRFSFRKVALVGSLLVFIGVVLTSFARSFAEFLVFYGIIMSAGYNLTMSAFAYAINTYFVKRRSMAMGFAMTVTGLGPVFMPLLISLAMREYGARATALLLGALSLHSAVGAMLLQPVRWHLKKVDEEVDKEDQEMEDLANKQDGLEAVAENPEAEARAGGGVAQNDKPMDKQVDKARRKKDDEEHDVEEDVRAPMLVRRRFSTASHKSGAPALSRATSTEPPGPLGTSMWASMASIDSEAYGGSIMNLNVDEKVVNGTSNGHKAELNGSTKPAEKDAKAVDEDVILAEAEPVWWRRWLRAVVLFFDLDLLRDPVYVNLMLGLSFAVFAEINFSLLTPFILHEHLGKRKDDTQEIATLVSIIAVADIVFRFLAPFVKKWCKQPVRVMYLIGLALLIATRTVLIWCYSYESLIGVMLSLGVAKGLRTVYWVLVIPDYVPIERLPAANGLQSVTNGLIFMALGPLIGVIRDKLGSYNYVIMATNTMTAITIVMWTTEFIVVAIYRKRRAKARALQDADEEKMMEAKMGKS